LKTPRTLTLKTFEKSSDVSSRAGLTTDTPAFCGAHKVNFRHISEMRTHGNDAGDGSELIVNLLQGADD